MSIQKVTTELAKAAEEEPEIALPVLATAAVAAAPVVVVGGGLVMRAIGEGIGEGIGMVVDALANQPTGATGGSSGSGPPAPPGQPPASSGSAQSGPNPPSNNSNNNAMQSPSQPPSLPNWDQLPKKSCNLYSVQMPNSFEMIVEGYDWESTPPIEATVQIAPKPFAFGTGRNAHYGRDVSDPSSPMDIVVKKFRSGVTFVEAANAVRMQNEAAFLATQFTAALNEKIGADGYAIEFLKVQMLKNGKEYMCIEKCFPADKKFLKFTNNKGYTMSEADAKEEGVDQQVLDTLTAFSHWTHQASKGDLMVTDLQGVISKGPDGKQLIELTDPAIHCTDWNRTHYGGTDMGEGGMKAFFRGHKCNQICQKLGLVFPEEYANLEQEENE